MTPERMAALHALSFDDSRVWAVKEFAELLSSPFVFLVPHHSGFALGRAVAREAELLTLAVDPAYRRQGIGRLLLSQFETIGKQTCDTAFLEVDESNLPALSLYKAAGFLQIGFRKDYYKSQTGQFSSAIVLGKALKT